LHGAFGGKGVVVNDLDDAYDNSGHIRDADQYPLHWQAQARAFRAELSAKARVELDLAYGRAARERFDLFLPDCAPVGLVLFVHGGYWRMNDKSLWSHLAAGSLARRFAVAIPSYTLAPNARISAITRQVALAVDAAASLVAGPIYLAGHSAGGHLVTRMLCGDISWSVCFRERVRRVVSISGLHDLRPLLQTSMNSDLKLDMAEAKAESPIFCNDPIPVPVVAWVGGNERPAFLHQAEWLAEAWPNARVAVDPGKHHFDVIEALMVAESPLITALLGSA